MDKVGISFSVDKHGNPKLGGHGIENLKMEIKQEMRKELEEYLQKEIIKSQDEKLRNALNDLKEAMKKKDGNLFDKTIKDLLKSGSHNVVFEFLKYLASSSGLL